jgi:chromosome segregation ATPase
LEVQKLHEAGVLQKKYELLEREKNNMCKLLQSLQAEKKQAEVELAKARKYSQNILENIEDYEASHDELFDLKTDYIPVIQKENAEMRAKCQQLTHQVEELTSEVVSLREKSQAMHEAYQEKNQQKECIAELEAKNFVLRQKCEDLENQVEFASKEVCQLQYKVKELTEDTTKANELEEENANLAQQMISLRCELSEANSRSLELAESVHKLQSESSSLRDQLADRAAHCDELKSSQECELKLSQDEVATWKDKAGEAEQELDQLKSLVNDVQAELVQARSEKDALQEEWNALTARQMNLQRLTENVRSLEAELESARSSADLKEELENRIQQLELELASLKSEKEMIEQETEELGEKVQDAYAEIDKINKEKQKLLEQVSEQEQTIKEMTERCQQATEERHCAQETIRELSDKLQHSEAGLEEAARQTSAREQAHQEELTDVR